MSIASEITRLQNAKANIKTAIEAKGVEIPSNATLDEYSDYVEEIPSGGTDTRWEEIGYDEEPSIIQDGIDYAKQIMQNWDASITDRHGAFYNDKNLIFFPNVDMSNVVNVNGMFSSCINLIYISDIDFSKINKNADSGTTNMFSGCSRLEEFGDVNIGLYVRSNGMFSSCTNLKKVGNITIGNSMYCDQMFYNCSNLEEIKSIHFLFTSYSTTTAQYLFYNCKKLTNNSLKKILIGLQDLTTQHANGKNLKWFNLSKTQAELCTTFDEWTPLANAGWTTGY